ncbi:MAG: hypothetical protein KGL39_55200 [Patescibacteria group bacterium]|nr:hypothetical protein [Patescibacteria group bacterium]
MASNSLDRATPLTRAIAHYKRIAKTATGNQAHYALGALDILAKVKEMRDDYREQARRAWYGRAGDGGDEYNACTVVIHYLDNLLS